MRPDALAVDCPAREPDPVLLAQLTALAAASTAPAVKPWWQRLTVKTGAAAVAGALLISGATADAEHGDPAPITATIVESPTHAALHHKPARVHSGHGSSSIQSPFRTPMRHAGHQPRHRPRVHGKKHQDGNSNVGGSQNSQNSQGQAPLQRTAAPLQTSPAPSPQGHSHPHTHLRQRSNSQH